MASGASGERPKKRKAERGSGSTESSRESASESASESKAAPAERRGKVARIALVVGAWAAIAIYVLDPVNAAMMIGLAALLGLMHFRSPEGEAQPRRMLGAGALLLLAGIATVGVGPSEVGVGLTLLALLVLAFGIHTFGRLGPEEAAPGL